jgi:hypothetical protein
MRVKRLLDLDPSKSAIYSIQSRCLICTLRARIPDLCNSPSDIPVNGTAEAESTKVQPSLVLYPELLTIGKCVCLVVNRGDRPVVMFQR